MNDELKLRNRLKEARFEKKALTVAARRNGRRLTKHDQFDRDRTI